MVELHSALRGLFRRTTSSGLVLALVAGGLATPAAAHHRHSHRSRAILARSIGHVRVVHNRPGSYTPPFASYAVDANSGRVLHAQEENALRHPASVTKVMTLYMLFEALEKGRLSLDTRIPISAHAASMPPTKLGLRPGSSIRVADAIGSMVTKSANDMAVAVAEAVGGDEATFAHLMTRKAHMLGMTRSNFVNASGLPAEQQLTTAHDLALLGRAIHDRYPHYFHYFSIPSFHYAGQTMPNHNHLMEQVEGMDGIKTGYTRDSGFNLLASVNRDGHWLIAVVLGGRTRLGRDRIMADIIAAEIDKCATHRTAPMVAENPALEQVAEAIPVIQHEGDDAPPVEAVDEEAAETTPAPDLKAASRAVATANGEGEESAAPDAKALDARTPDPKDDGDTEPQPSRHAKPARTRAPAQVASLAPQPRPRPAFVPGLPKGERDMTATGSIPPRGGRADGSTSRYTGASTATPSALRHPASRHDREETNVASLEAQPTGRPATHGGVMIQIGATPTVAEANGLLARARSQSHGTLAGASSFTEKLQKGHGTLFRARFAGLTPDAADAACRALKRSGVSCFTTKN